MIASRSKLMGFDYALAIGLPFTLATNLRLGDLGVGLGELFLVAWVGWVLFSRLGSTRTTVAAKTELAWNKSWMSVVEFWGASVILLSIGTFWSLVFALSDPPERFRDLIAYLLVCGVCAAIWLRQYTVEQLRLVFKIGGALFVLILFATWIAYAQTGANILGAEEMSRFSGVSKNPNQPGVLLAPFPFFAAYFAARTNSLASSTLWIALGAAAVWAGSQTMSDGLALAWYAGCLAAGGVALGNLLAGGASRSNGPVVMFAVVAVAGVAAFLWSYMSEAPVFREIAESVSSGWDGSDSRLELWMNAIDKLQSSPIFGFGVGAHSYLGVDGPRFGSEAHNSLVDWALQTGALGLIALLWLLFRIGWNAWASRSGFLFGALVAVVFGSLTNFPLRHPMFWVNLAVIVALAFQARQRQRPPSQRDALPQAPAEQIYAQGDVR